MRFIPLLKQLKLIIMFLIYNEFIVCLCGRKVWKVNRLHMKSFQRNSSVDVSYFNYACRSVMNYLSHLVPLLFIQYYE